MKTTYKTTDFYQAVVLKSLGFLLLGLEKIDERTYSFVFDDSNATATTIVSQYWDRKIKIEARNFVGNINELKTRIHTAA